MHDAMEDTEEVLSRRHEGGLCTCGVVGSPRSLHVVSSLLASANSVGRVSSGPTVEDAHHDASQNSKYRTPPRVLHRSLTSTRECREKHVRARVSSRTAKTRGTPGTIGAQRRAAERPLLILNLS